MIIRRYIYLLVDVDTYAYTSRQNVEGYSLQVIGWRLPNVSQPSMRECPRRGFVLSIKNFRTNNIAL